VGAEDLGEFHQATAENEMRALATIARIDAIREHRNAYRLELATIRGWQVVVEKGIFKEGDLVVYCEIDSILPEREEFEFMRHRNFRVKTIKLRGELSQGICFPLSILPEYVPYDTSWMDGDDVTDELDIVKYEIPQPAVLAGDAKGVFPSFIPKTDSERIQNHPWILDEYRELEWVVTEKLDGTSCTVYWQDGELHVCSRNLELKDGPNVYWRVAKWLDLEDKLRDLNLALQGEIIGPGIQGNRYQRSELEFRCFDIWDMDEGYYIPHRKVMNFCCDCGILTVPMVYEPRTIPETLSELLQIADGRSLLNHCQREGLVWKPVTEQHDSRIGRLQFKAISNRFLLKHE
jgi:RNA ligase (TIGR02306 family)